MSDSQYKASTRPLSPTKKKHMRSTSTVKHGTTRLNSNDRSEKNPDPQESSDYKMTSQKELALLKVSPMKIVVETSPADKRSVRKVSQIINEEEKEESITMSN